MNRAAAELIRESFIQIREQPVRIAMLFYGRLFDLEPSVRQYFPQDMRAQSRKLMDMIEVVVDGLDRFDQLRPALRELGLRHAGYGARPEHYPLVTSALLWTFGQALDREFYPEVRKAWADALEEINREMLAGSAGCAK